MYRLLPLPLSRRKPLSYLLLLVHLVLDRPNYKPKTSSSYDIYSKIPRYILSFPNISRFLLFLVW
nr:MAG TPA: hypothetical protein [Caudoviricetes sp.]